MSSSLPKQQKTLLITLISVFVAVTVIAGAVGVWVVNRTSDGYEESLILTKRARVYYLYRGLQKVYIAPVHEDGRDLLRVEDAVFDLKDLGVAN